MFISRSRVMLACVFIVSYCLLTQKIYGAYRINSAMRSLTLQKHLTSDKVLIGLLKIQTDLEQNTLDYQLKLESLCKKDVIKALLIFIDSHGGSSTGTYKILEVLNHCREKKPLVAFIPSVAFSAAYKLASHCTSIVATPLAFIGSIGTLMQSEKLHNVAAYYQDLHSCVDNYNFYSYQANTTEAKSINETLSFVSGHFKTTVSNLRNLDLSESSLWGEGKIFTGRQAYTLKLIDHLGSYTTALQVITELIRAKNITEHKDLKPEQLLLVEEA